MIDRDKILRFYKGSGDGDLAARLLDQAEDAVRSRRYQVTEFLDPHGLSIAETIVAHEESLLLSTHGGYPSAERQRACFQWREFRGEPVIPISAVQMEWDVRYYDIGHRDVLGGLMAQGLKRGLIGDIIVLPKGGRCQVIVDTTARDLFLRELERLGNAPVQTSEIALTELSPRPETVKELKATVASLRIDAVAAAGFGMSRTQIAEDIKADKLKVNWKETKNAAQTVKPGDVISFRGRGRVEFVDVTGQTKKGRTGVLLKRYV